MKFLHDETLFRLQAKALEGKPYAGTGKPGGYSRKNWGDYTSASSLEWDIAGRCQSPVTVEHRSRKDMDRHHECPARGIILHVKCRKCERCLKERAWKWIHRARLETAAADRTWFITLTFNPTIQQNALDICRMRLIRNGLDFDALKSSEQIQLRHNVVGKHVTLFLKRLRKQTNASVRYLLVMEAHESGAPHYHMLLHHSVEPTVTYRDIETQWKSNGFLHAKLVDTNYSKAVWYVCKYIAKSSEARVRASLDYGSAQRPLDIADQIRSA